MCWECSIKKKRAGSTPCAPLPSDPKGHENLSLQSHRNVGWKAAGPASLPKAKPMSAAEQLSHGLVQPDLRSNSRSSKGEQPPVPQPALPTEFWSDWIFSGHPCTASFPHQAGLVQYLTFGEQRRSCAAWCGAWKMQWKKKKKSGYHKVININKVNSKKPGAIPSLLQWNSLCIHCTENFKNFLSNGPVQMYKMCSRLGDSVTRLPMGLT